MVLPIHSRGFIQILQAVAFVAVFTTVSGNALAQQDTGEDAGGANGGDSTQFQPEEVDLSAFDGIERGDTVGTASTQGFGLAEDAGGATGGGFAGAGGGGGGGGFGGLGGLFGGLGGAFGGQGAASSQKPIIRVRLRAAIGLPPRAPEEVQQSVSRALSAAPVRSGVRGVSVTMQGRTAILSGAVTSERERRMSELLIRLEPGVNQVDNRVTVGN